MVTKSALKSAGIESVLVFIAPTLVPIPNNVAIAPPVMKFVAVAL
uniref:Uncharacterized protein n=1 Tax=Wolbachia endosymbiont of Aleurodicus floccissimus TaxID=2152762 RepID=A0A3B0IY31_9RICK